jgi:hypothetical protein
MIAETPSSLCTSGASPYDEGKCGRLVESHGSAPEPEWSASAYSTTTTDRQGLRRTRSSCIRCLASPASPDQRAG